MLKRSWSEGKFGDDLLGKSIHSKETREKVKGKQESAEHAEKMSALSKRAWRSDERKRQASESSIRTWSSQDFILLQRRRQTEKWGEARYRAAQAEARKSVELRKKISDTTRLALSGTDIRNKMSGLAKERWSRPEYRVKLGLARAEFARGKPSSLERVVGSILDTIGVEYVPQHPLDHFLFDFFLPKEDLLIEVQGEYWHGTEKVMAKDASKFRKVDEYFPGLRILYLFEKDFMNPAIVSGKIRSAIAKEKPGIKQTDFCMEDVVVRKVGLRAVARDFLNSFHYAAYGRSAKVVYGAYLGETLIAVCKFSTPHRKEVATSIGQTPSKVLDVDRFCINPSFQKKNFASWFLSRCAKSVWAGLPAIEVMVAFADMTHGHSGTIYSASGWRRLGKIRPDYHYVGPNGMIIHKKTLYNHAKKMSMRESEYAREHEYVKAYGKEKIKFSLSRSRGPRP